MSNCYTTFYFELPLPSSGLAKEVSALLDLADDYFDMDPDRKEKILPLINAVFEEFHETECLGFEWHVRLVDASDIPDLHMIHVRSDECGDTTHAGNLIQWLLPRLDIDAAGFEYACYGDGENGGGAQFFRKSKDGVVAQYENTGSWLARQAKRVTSNIPR